MDAVAVELRRLRWGREKISAWLKETYAGKTQLSALTPDELGAALAFLKSDGVVDRQPGQEG